MARKLNSLKIIEKKSYLDFGTNKESLLGKLGVIAIYVAVYLKDIMHGFGIYFNPAVLLSIGVILSVVSILTNRRINLSGLDYLAFVAMVFLLGGVFNNGVTFNNYIIAPFVAYLILHSAKRTFVLLLLMHLFMTVFIQFWEYLVGNYLFAYVTDDFIELDAQYFAGNAGVLRAKGMFQGPLNAVAFAAWMMFFFRKKLVFSLIMFLVSFFAMGRLGLIVSVLWILVLSFLEKTSKKQRIFHYLLFLLLPIVSIVFASDEQHSFFLKVADWNYGGNAARLFFWRQAIETYLNFDFLNIIFGKYDFARGLLSIENDFLRIAIDNGFFISFLYFFILARIIFLSKMRRDVISLLAVILIFLMMNLFPMIQSLSSTVLFWIFCFFEISRDSKYRFIFVEKPQLKFLSSLPQTSSASVVRFR